MEFIGSYLKDIRRKKKIKIKSVSLELKISIDLLENIEKDYFPNYMENVFLIGHINSYAKYLGLDQKEIVKNFKIQNTYNEDELKKEITKPIKINNIYSVPRALSYFSCIVFVSGFYFLFIKTNDFQSNYALTPDVPENLMSSLEATEMNMVLSKIDTENLEFTKIKKKLILENQVEVNNSSSVVASTPKDEDTNEFNEKIILKFLNPTWIQLRNLKDEIIFSRLMDQGDQYSYKISDNYGLTAGNAGNIIITLNNVVLGKVGKAGEVVDSLIINKNFNK